MNLQPHLDRLAAACLGLPVRRTDRLVLRPFQERDRAPFAAMNADPEVMAHLPAVLDGATSDALLDRFRVQAARRGFGVFAVEERATGAFVGWSGLWVPDWEAAFTPAVELTWRLVRPAWGQGYGTEAARSTVAYAFDSLRLPRLMAWTSPENERSWRLMERIGMTRVGTFVHPAVPEGHRLSEHVRYVIEAAAAQPEPASPSESMAATPERPLPRVWIDGDGCPRLVKEIVWKAAHRGVVTVTLVANRAMLVPRSPRIRSVVVPKGMDVADDWLVANAGPNELVITSDVPLAAELVPRGVHVMSPRGEWFTPANIGEKLSLRDFFTDARAAGMIEGGGPAGFDERTKRTFANGLDAWIARAQLTPRPPA